MKHIFLDSVQLHPLSFLRPSLSAKVRGRVRCVSVVTVRRGCSPTPWKRFCAWNGNIPTPEWWWETLKWVSLSLTLIYFHSFIHAFIQVFIQSLCVCLGIEVKFKNMVYPVILAPSFIPELNSVTHTEDGEYHINITSDKTATTGHRLKTKTQIKDN